ncbi:MAG: hypothetical protein E3J82_01470 [Candidatus Thorarchaeota archaeon]|nr:MAG: hypothetical protein E3J82_01470 [Candidatus Thorarchaeota archaeon]
MARGTVQLKNGAVELKVFVASIMLVLDRLVDEKPVAALDLVMKCRDSSYQFFSDNEEILQARNLVEKHGTIHSSIRNVVLSAFEGDGFDMVLHSPVATGS